MPRKPRQEAHAIARILDRKTRVVVGWLYQWNTGERTPKWKKGVRTDVIYAGQPQETPKP
ncbi:hypothetical protein [Sulfitobacter sp.]|uniref:hypothetical protein n=1 Tax=Sulfitobacter sp. TaxID=1903071 RepID=UPI0030023BEF